MTQLVAGSSPSQHRIVSCGERRLWLTVQFELKNGQRFSEDCMIDTGAPLCVIPYEIHEYENLKWQCLTDPSPNEPPRGPFNMYAKFPRAPVRGFRHLLVGTNFFADNQGEAFFQYSKSATDGYVDFA